MGTGMIPCVASLYRDSRGPGLLDLDDQYADFCRPQVFNRVWRKRRHALDAGGARQFPRLPAVEENLSILISAEKVAAALDISDSAPTVRMQRHHIARRYCGSKHPHALIFE